MKSLLSAATLAAIAITTIGGSAHAATLCNLTGVYNDEFGIATAKVKGLRGQLSAPSICATPYNFKITNETVTGFDVKGGNTTKSCGAFKATATFQNSCSVFTAIGTVHGMKITDTFTKQGAARAKPKADASLSRGFK